MSSTKCHGQTEAKLQVVNITSYNIEFLKKVKYLVVMTDKYYRSYKYTKDSEELILSYVSLRISKMFLRIRQ